MPDSLPKHHFACPVGIKEALGLAVDAPCRCADLGKIDDSTYSTRAGQHLWARIRQARAGQVPITFSGRRGSEVLSLEGRKPVTDLKRGEKVLVPSMFGYFLATVAETEGDLPYAESKGLLFPMWQEDGKWWCDSAISNSAAEQAGRAVMNRGQS